MKGMNLSKFKKLKESAGWADMIHADGHILRIAKAPLSPIHRKQLEALPYANSQTGKYKDGGEVDKGLPPLEVEAIENADAQPPLQAEPVNQAPLQVEPVAQQAQVPAQVQVPTPQMSGAQLDQNRSNVLNNISQGSPSQGQPQSQPQQPQTPVSALQGKNSAVQQEQQANSASAAAEQQKANEIVDANNDVERRQRALPTQNQLIEKYRASGQNLMNEFSKGLDPDKYWKDHSKTSAGIGVAISALGQALGGTNGNVAMTNIKEAVNRDIQIQKDDRDKNYNLWKMNRQMLGDDLSANLATQNQLYTGLQYKIQKASAKAVGAGAVANAQKANAELEQLKAENNYKLSLMNPTSDNPDPSTRVNVLVPAAQQARAFDEIKQKQYIVKNAPGILAAFDEAAKDSRFLGGHTLKSIAPGFHTPGQNKFMGLIAPTVLPVEGSVNQQTFKNLDDRFTPNFTDAAEDLPGKRAALIEYLTGKDSTPVTKGSGIDLNKFPSTDTSRIGQQGAPGAEKPDLIKQGGRTYQLNRSTGQYEQQ